MTNFIAATSIELSEIPLEFNSDYSLTLAGTWKSKGTDLLGIEVKSLLWTNAFYSEIYNCCANSEDCRC